MSDGFGRPMVALMLLAGMVGLGAWNFHRNVAVEKQEPRPFRTYSDSEVEALITAYEEDIASFTRKWEKVTGEKVNVQNFTHRDSRIREFERVQKIGRQTREMTGELAKRHVALGELHEEQAKRVQERRVVLIFLKRLFTYNG
jgi:hypothetical protein